MCRSRWPMAAHRPTDHPAGVSAEVEDPGNPRQGDALRSRTNLRRKGKRSKRGPEGWSKSRIDPTPIVDLFPPLRLAEGYVLRAYVFREGGNGNGVVSAMPTDADFPEPKDCPKLDMHRLKAPKPCGRSRRREEAIEGTAPRWSYLAASLLRRELPSSAPSGTASTGVRTPCSKTIPSAAARLTHSNPDRTGPPRRSLNGSGPQSRAPHTGDEVAVAADRVMVTFYTYCGRETEAIYRFTDTYRPGQYRARVDEKTWSGGLASCPDLVRGRLGISASRRLRRTRYGELHIDF